MRTPEIDSDSATSLSLLERAKQQDAIAWRRLVDLYGPHIYRWARMSRLEKQDALDVVQEVFISIAKNLSGFRRDRPSDGFRRWLWTITKNKVRNHWNKSRRQPRLLGTELNALVTALPEVPPEENSATELQQAKALLARRAIGMLKSDFREHTWLAFWKTEVENGVAADVAAELEMSVGAVYTARSRVLKRLREEFRGLLD